MGLSGQKWQRRTLVCFSEQKWQEGEHTNIFSKVILISHLIGYGGWGLLTILFAILNRIPLQLYQNIFCKRYYDNLKLFRSLPEIMAF